jgi:hypothetical protein
MDRSLAQGMLKKKKGEACASVIQAAPATSAILGISHADPITY